MTPKGGHQVFRRWTEDEALEALRRFRDEHGRVPLEEELHKVAELGIPNISVLYRLFGAPSNAYVLAYGEAPSKNHNDKDPDTEEVLRRLADGASLSELARERGITGQSLGRRVNRYQRMYGLPVVKRRPGAPRMK